MEETTAGFVGPAVPLISIACSMLLPAMAQDLARPESLAFNGGRAAQWKEIPFGRSSLQLREGWSLYPRRRAKDGRAPWVVAARSVDRVLGRSIVVTTDNIHAFLRGTEQEPEARVRDERAAEELFRALVDGRPIERGLIGERLIGAAQKLERDARLGPPRDRRDERVHERLLHWKVRVVGLPNVAWRVKAKRRGSGFDVAGCFYRDWAQLKLVEVRGHITRQAAVELSERVLVEGPPVFWSSASISTGEFNEEEDRRQARNAREMRADVALAQRRFDAALDPRRSIDVAKRLCASDQGLTRVAIVSALGAPDFEIGNGEDGGEDGALVYGLWDGRVLEFVGRPRIRELRLAEVPRPRSALSEKYTSGALVERLWKRDS